MCSRGGRLLLGPPAIIFARPYNQGPPTHPISLLSILTSSLIIAIFACLVGAAKGLTKPDSIGNSNIPGTKALGEGDPNTEGGSQKQEVKIAAILPKDNKRLFSILKTTPAINYAIERVEKDDVLPRHKLVVKYLDSACSSTNAPLAAFEFYMEKQVDVFFGPVCDYSLAPVARYSPEWNIPVITPGGMAHDFSEKVREYRSLTRVGITFDSLAVHLLDTLDFFRWDKVKVLYNSMGHQKVVSHFCFLAMSAFIKRLRGTTKRFHLFLLKENATNNDLDGVLREEVGTKYASKQNFLLDSKRISATFFF